MIQKYHAPQHVGFIDIIIISLPSHLTMQAMSKVIYEREIINCEQFQISKLTFELSIITMKAERLKFNQNFVIKPQRASNVTS